MDKCSNILCHIIGLNELMKKKLYDDINNIIVEDLDIITHKLRSDKELVKLENKISTTNKDNKELHKSILDEHHKLWKTKLEKKIDNICMKNKTKMIILIGLTTHHKYSKLFVNINTKYKYIINIESHKNTKQVIEYNIDKYKKHIINGTFPLKYLDHKFLKKQHHSLYNIYKNKNYSTKSLNGIINWIKLKTNTQSGGNVDKNIDDKIYIKVDNVFLKNTKINDNTIKKSNDGQILYIGLKDKFTKPERSYDRSYGKKHWIQDTDVINMVNGISDNMIDISEKITAYDTQWLAVLSALDLSKYIRKGYLQYKDKKIPYIEEKKNNAFDKLNASAYLYKITSNKFNKVGYKFVSYGINPYNDAECEHIDNIYNTLKNYGVKMIKYNKTNYNKWNNSTLQ